MYYEIKDLSREKLEKILVFTRTLLLYFSIGNYIFTHAGANVQKPIEENVENETVWMSESFPCCPAYSDKVLVFGHEPTWNLYSYDKKFKKKDAKIWYDTTNKDNQFFSTTFQYRPE
ncbi:hypothetical protein Ga0466249_002848 [Sporomusaceae bacterium BoRhaA]|uniref:hypothetical protein n=1 Tax=Pelorhabdus rhamnosifermentans TaxID=2772457 RepID=UPI001C061F41|nr:hypothetical protein [Pelorhabdus rhamnosifermentans]MBU2701729.1 hypothetical protein [Pelorhabdus rhamnosifermentans]